MPSNLARPPYDAELIPTLDESPRPKTLTPEIISMLRANPDLLPKANLAEIIGERPISHVERRVPALNSGDPAVILSIFTPKSPAQERRPCIYWMHGGGRILMDRFLGIHVPLNWMAETGAVVISVEYRLAPEFPEPAASNDCYAGLLWVDANTEELGIDPERLLVAGQSAGGGLAAGIALMARDRGGPKLCGQFLGCPMLDDRNMTVSSQQYIDEGMWSRGTNVMAWDMVLARKAGTADVSIYSAPARAWDLAGLPTTFIDVGSAETFRDEDVAYASRLWAAGVQAELHVYPGGFHGFTNLAPQSRLGALAIAKQTEWVKFVLLGSRFGETELQLPQRADVDNTLSIV